MFKFNIFSILFYIAILFPVYKGWFRFFTSAVYMEVVVHMVLAVIFTGWQGGFQVTLIGMNVLAFYSDYIGRSLKLKHANALCMGLVGMVSYLASYAYIRYNPAPYTLPGEVTFWLTLMWGFIVFVINLFALQTFIIIASKYEEKLQHQMSHDMLTGLPNRYYMSEHLEEIQNNGSLKGYWIALADIDDFKSINDTYGHNCGDFVLNTIAKIFSKNSEVLCCRWGGEEFLFIGKTDGNTDAGYSYLESLRLDIAKHPFVFGGKVLAITSTFGMAEYKEGQSIDAWISEADDLLYKGKKKGKNQVVA